MMVLRSLSEAASLILLIQSSGTPHPSYSLGGVLYLLMCGDARDARRVAMASLGMPQKSLPPLFASPLPTMAFRGQAGLLVRTGFDSDASAARLLASGHWEAAVACAPRCLAAADVLPRLRHLRKSSYPETTQPVEDKLPLLWVFSVPSRYPRNFKGPSLHRANLQRQPLQMQPVSYTPHNNRWPRSSLLSMPFEASFVVLPYPLRGFGDPNP